VRYVGDAPQDVEMARRAGVRAIGVLGPFPTERRLRAARPEFLIGSIEELPDVLKRYSADGPGSWRPCLWFRRSRRSRRRGRLRRAGNGFEVRPLDDQTNGDLQSLQIQRSSERE